MPFAAVKESPNLDGLRRELLPEDVLVHIAAMLKDCGAGQIVLNINEKKLASYNLNHYYRVK